MKQRVLPITLVILGTLALTAMLAQAQTISNGPYYATPSWDQKLQCDTLATCPRFVVLSNWNNEAVLDRETGLVWEQRAPGFFNWSDAQTHCNQLVLGGRMGWRLPVVQELTSLSDQTAPGPGPKLPAGHPFSDVFPAFYWSATTSFRHPGFAWGLFAQNGVPGDLDKTTRQFVWCVRGGHGVDPQ